MPRERDFVMWAVYRFPTDAPDHYVVRRFEIHAGTVVPTQDSYRARTYKKVERLMERSGLVRMLRSPGDEPQILETWM